MGTLYSYTLEYDFVIKNKTIAKIRSNTRPGQLHVDRRFNPVPTYIMRSKSTIKYNFEKRV